MTIGSSRRRWDTTMSRSCFRSGLRHRPAELARGQRDESRQYAGRPPGPVSVLEGILLQFHRHHAEPNMAQRRALVSARLQDAGAADRIDLLRSTSSSRRRGRSALHGDGNGRSDASTSEPMAAKPTTFCARCSRQLGDRLRLCAEQPPPDRARIDGSRRGF